MPAEGTLLKHISNSSESCFIVI